MPKININGVTREMTAEEVAEMEALAAEMPEAQQTAEERIAALEADNANLKEALELLLSGVTGDE